MTKLILQNAGAILLSFFVALLLLACIEWVGAAVLHPFPADFAGTREEVMQHVAIYPTWALFVGGIGWVITMITATWLATRLSSNRHPAYGIGIGLLLLGGAIFNMAILPYPLWFWILCLVLLPLGIYFGVRLGMQNSARK